MQHIRAIDGLRGVAVALVVVSHVAPDVLPGGFLGVDVFFVLSGFLITSILLEEVGRRGRIDVGRFYVRRCARLLPALLLLLGSLGAYSATVAAPEELSRLREHSLWTLGYLANWRFIADGTTYTDLVVGQSPLRHAWSLAVEEQFYIVFPLLVVVVGIAVGRDARRLRWSVLALAVVGAGASATWAAWRFDPADPSRGYFGTDTRIQALLVGVALGALLVGRPPVSGRWAGFARATSSVGLVVLAIAVAVADESAAWLQRGGFTVVALATSGLLAGIHANRRVRRALRMRPLVRLGIISYGVYLWHWPIIVLVDAERTHLSRWPLVAVQLAATFVAATASYVLVERPIRAGALRRTFGRRPALAVTPAAIALVTVVVVVTTTPPAPPTLASAAAPPVTTSIEIATPAEAADASWSDSSPADARTAPDGTDAGEWPPTITAARERLGDSSTTAPPADPTTTAIATTTTAATPSAPRRVVMLGDSVAHTLAGGVVDEFPRFRPWAPTQSSFDAHVVDLRSAAQPGCSFLAGEILAPDGIAIDLSGFCGDWDGELSAGLTTSAAPLVVVALANDAADRLVDGHTVGLDSAAFQSVLAGWLDQVVLATAAADGEVVLVALPPRTGRFATAADVDGRRERLMREQLRSYAANHPDSVRVFDLFEVICPAGDCSSPPAGFDPAWRYDGMHFTPDGARWVADLLERQLLASPPAVTS